MRIAQVLNNKAHWVFEADGIPSYPPTPEGESILLVDITDYPEVKEGWHYNAETGGFSEPIDSEIQSPDDPQPTLDEKIDSLQSDNLTQFEVLATVYEEMSTSNLTQFEVMATMYEELIELRSEVEQLKGGSTE